MDRKENIFLDAKPFAGGEDVGFYFEKVPGAMLFLGCTPPNQKNPVDLHNPEFQIDLEALQYGTLIHINNVLDFLK